MEFSLADIGALADVAQRVDSDPLSLVGRILGMAPEETKVGIPGWAWATVVMGAGAYLGWRYGDQVTGKLLGAKGDE
jgi:hypothetical protein